MNTMNTMNTNEMRHTAAQRRAATDEQYKECTFMQALQTLSYYSTFLPNELEKQVREHVLSIEEAVRKAGIRDFKVR